MTEMKNYLENRIKELRKADAKFCEMRCDMNRPQLARNLYREASNEVTGRIRELEDALTFFNNLLKPDVKGSFTDKLKTVVFDYEASVSERMDLIKEILVNDH